MLKTVLFQAVQFSLVYVHSLVVKIHNSVLMLKPVLFQAVQFSLVYVHSLVVKFFPFQAIQFSQAVLIQTIQFSISIDFVYTQLNVKTVLY